MTKMLTIERPQIAGLNHLDSERQGAGRRFCPPFGSTALLRVGGKALPQLKQVADYKASVIGQ